MEHHVWEDCLLLSRPYNADFYVLLAFHYRSLLSCTASVATLCSRILTEQTIETPNNWGSLPPIRSHTLPTWRCICDTVSTACRCCWCCCCQCFCGAAAASSACWLLRAACCVFPACYLLHATCCLLLSGCWLLLASCCVLMLAQLPAGAAADAAGVADSAGAAGRWIHDVVEGLERPRNDPGTTLERP